VTGSPAVHLSPSALEDALAGSARRRGGTQLVRWTPGYAANVIPLEFRGARELYVTHRFAFPFEHATRVGMGRASRKAEVDVPGAGGDVAKHVLHLPAEAEPDGHGVDLMDRFGRVRSEFYRPE
jgi:hypothetical protein